MDKIETTEEVKEVNEEDPELMEGLSRIEVTSFHKN